MALLVCPVCRTVVNGRLDLRTVERRGDEMVCECGAAYPIVDGIPRIAPGATAAPEVLDDVTLEHLSIYLTADWGRTDALHERIAARASEPVAAAVELGCSAGRIVAELAKGARHVVGIDVNASILSRAKRLLDGETVEYQRRIIGTSYEPATVSTTKLAADRFTLVCADALDPPLVPQHFDRVVALNVLDAVPHPRQLLMVMSALCAPGGELIIASPYQWHEGVEPAERFGGADPAGELVRLLTSGKLGAPYETCDEAEVRWELRRNARSAITFQSHYVRARKA
ncbi:MAG TPA: methyltransferase domain-containing protein [Kofleriaceae bacterium]|jgi:SAM-dependent methyltransferase